MFRGILGFIIKQEEIDTVNIVFRRENFEIEAYLPSWSHVRYPTPGHHFLSTPGHHFYRPQGIIQGIISCNSLSFQMSVHRLSNLTHASVGLHVISKIQ